MSLCTNLNYNVTVHNFTYPRPFVIPRILKKESITRTFGPWNRRQNMSRSSHRIEDVKLLISRLPKSKLYILDLYTQSLGEYLSIGPLSLEATRVLRFMYMT